jgi:hypothetical protein
MAAALTGSLLIACTAFEPGSDVLDVERGQSLPSAPGESWGCLAAERSPAQPPSGPVFAGDGRRIVLSGRILDLSTGASYPGITVRACGISDIDCATPVIENVVGDAEGWVDIPLFEGFDGFLEVTSDDVLPSIFFLGDPIDDQPRNAYPWGIVARASVQPLINLVGVPQEAGRGFLAMRAFDCELDTAPGVSFTLEGEGSPFYFIGGLPTGAASATDGVGLGGFSNVPAGLAVVDALTPDGTSIMGAESVVVRPGWVSTLFVQPPEELRLPPP